MAGMGEWNSLSKEALKTAFDNAKAEGAYFLVHFSYTSEGASMGMAGVPTLLEMIDINEAARGIGLDDAEWDLKALFNEYGNIKIEWVYLLKGPFEKAVRGSENLLPQGAMDNVRSELAREAHEAKMAARPLWKKLLGLKF